MKLAYRMIVLFLLFGAMMFGQNIVRANDVCNDSPSDPNSQCQWIWDEYCEVKVFNEGTPYQYETEICTMKTQCYIPQGNGTGCSCCWEDGCYLSCGSNITPSGSPSGDDTAPPDPTAPPGSTPVPTATPAPGTITAVARAVTSDQTCDAVSSSTDPITGTVFSFGVGSASQPTPQTQTDNTPVTFSTMPVGSYTLSYTLPSPDWTLANPCIYRNGTLIAYGTTATLTGSATLDWRIGFTRGSAWVQTQGGDVTAATSVRSYVPSAATPRVFHLDGTGGYPGVVRYGTQYDFDNNWLQTGTAYTSSTDWLVRSADSQTDYYDYFYRRFGAPTTPTADAAFTNLLAVTKPSSSTTPYYVVGDMTTSGDWSVGDGETVIIVVNGNLTIDGNIRMTGTTGFLAFIVNGNITVNSTVGRSPTGTTPNIEGIYVTSPTGSFITGSSLVSGTSRLVGKGMFVAGNFTLQRDLDGFGTGNTTDAAELFIYDPRYLVTMPDAMKDVGVTWQEVAP